MNEQAEKPFTLRDTIIPKSDQLNYDDFIAGPKTRTVTKVSRGNPEQPVLIYITGEDRPWKPNKTMRRVLIAAWGDKGREWVDKSLMLVGDPSVTWAGAAVGGIVISRLSDIPESGLRMMLTKKRGQRVECIFGFLKTTQHAADAAGKEG